MARKWGVFFHSVYGVLKQVPIQRSGIQRFTLRRRLCWRIYGPLAAMTFMLIILPSGSAQVTGPGFPTRDIPQKLAQISPEQPQAQLLDQLARDHYEAGKFSDAAMTFEQAAVAHQQSGQWTQAAASQVNQARALHRLGLYSRALMVLQRALQTDSQSPLLLQDLGRGEPALTQLQARLAQLPAAPTTVFALRSLGETLEVIGDLNQAQLILAHGLELAEGLSLDDAIPPLYLSMGNLTRTQAMADLRLDNLNIGQALAQLQKDLSPIQQELQRRQIEAAQQYILQTEQALDDYRQVIEAEAGTALLQVQAYLNTLSLWLDRQQWSEAVAVVPVVESLLDQLPLNRPAVMARINLAESLMRLAEETPNAAMPAMADPQFKAAQLLATVQQQATTLGTPQIESYAFGSLGQLYSRTQQWPEAKALTQQALDKINGISVTNLPMAVNDADLAYRWYRQLGRILNAQGDTAGAIEAYETAVQILQNRLRLDVAPSNLNYQYSFAVEAQEPVHRELMGLLLQADEPSPKHLQRVREVTSALLEAELTSFLQEPCSIATPQQVDVLVQESDQKTALIYPVVLPDRLEVIVKLPQTEDLLHYRHQIPRDELLAQLDEFQHALEEDYTFKAVETLAQEFYAWLIQPAEEQLQASQVETLVFTLDRLLQPIPMAVLYDGEQYLVEKFAIADFLGLSVDRAHHALQPGDVKIMAAGLSTIPPNLPEEIENNFLPLTYVSQELAALRTLRATGIGVDTLEDDEFTQSDFNNRLNEDQFPVVHLATHGQFSVDPQRTFLLTSGSSTEALIEVNELAALFRVRGQIRLDSIELLVLNACETAAGDNLATLGLAGTAVRAGAGSAIASLWTLDDAPSVMFTQTLYDYLRQPGMSKARALQQAQLALLQTPQYRHPRYWSPYILAGNWLSLTTTSVSTGTAGSSGLS
jgi:CHAT domain-containing protein